MDSIDKELNDMAEKLEKSAQSTEFSMEILKSTVLKLGPAGLKKAMARLNPEQKELLKSLLEDMKKSHRDLISRDKPATLEPVSNSTASGDYLFNEDAKPAFTAHDEMLDDEANKRKQMEHKNQGGNNPPAGWEGQVIKSETAPDVKKSEGCEPGDNMDKPAMPDQMNDMKKLKKMKKKLKKALRQVNDELEKGGANSGRRPMGPGLEGVQSVKDMHERTAEAAKVASKFPEKEMSLDDKKKAAKKNLKKMMSRMQERKLEKSVCVAALAKSLEVAPEKISQIWDALAKGDVLPEKGNPEGSQSAVPDQMKDGSKKAKGDGKPESGKAATTADESNRQIPAPMAKADTFWHEEEDVYLTKSEDPFKVRKVGQNAHYNVDDFIALEDASKQARLKKSTFDYQTEDQIAKAQPAPGDDAAASVAANAKANSQAKKDEKEAQRNAQIDDKLTRIEERAGPKMPMLKGKMKKSIVNDLIEKSLDMDDATVFVAQANQARQAQGAFLVKSFADTEMDELFQAPDMWKSEKKAEEKKGKEKLKKDSSPEDDKPDAPAPVTGGY